LGIPGEKLFALGLVPKQVVWFRAAICFVGMTGICLIFNRARLKIELHKLPLMFLYGAIGVAMFYFAYFNAIDMTGMAMAAILLYTAPAMVVLISRLVFKENIDFKKIFCILLTTTGCFLVVKGYDVNNLKLNMPGILMGLLAGFSYAMYSVFGKMASASVHPWTVIVYTQGIGLIVLSFLHFPAEVFAGHYESTVWLYLLYIGIVPTLLAYLCYNAALKNVEAGRASIIATLEPVVAVFLAYVFLGQVLDSIQALGAALVVSAVAIVQLPAKLPKRKR